MWALQYDNMLPNSHPQGFIQKDVTIQELWLLLDVWLQQMLASLWDPNARLSYRTYSGFKEIYHFILFCKQVQLGDTVDLQNLDHESKVLLKREL